MKLTPAQFETNQAWIVARLDSMLFVKDEPVDVYVLVDAASTYVFGQIVYLGSTPSRQEFKALFKRARKKGKGWPTKLYIPKEDPAEDMLKGIASGSGITPETIPLPYLDPILGPLKESFAQFQSGKEQPSEPSEDLISAKAMIPDSYDLCPCASGKKYKFCCKAIVREVTEAMCAVEEGHFDVALKFLDEAKGKVGETAEVLSRYAIAHSLRSEEAYLGFLQRALEANPHHPRTHYLLGLNHKEHGRVEEAEAEYLKAIESYPVSDKYHLNETWNNLGVLYFEIGDLTKAKGAWEKALVYLPSDVVTRNNLREFIYDNPRAPTDLRTPSPFVARYL